jgi:hypothetical protein
MLTNDLGFCMARIVTLSLRISWAYFPHNVKLAIAAQVFVAAGVVIIFIVNLVFAQRMIRASHPRFGWHPMLGSWTFKLIYIIIFLTITMLITATVDSFYVISPYIHHVDRSIQLYGVTCFAIIAFLPIPLVLLLLAIPRSHPLDNFGKGHWRTKPVILLTGTTLIAFGAIYRAVTTWFTMVPMSQPMPSYLHKAAFYIANFTVEILVVYLYGFTRVDQHFYVPDGSKKRKSYIMPNEKRGGDAEAATLPDIRLSKSQETLGDLSTLGGGHNELKTVPEEDEESRRGTKDFSGVGPLTGNPNGDIKYPYGQAYITEPAPTARTHISLNQPMHIPTLNRQSQVRFSHASHLSLNQPMPFDRYSQNPYSSTAKPATLIKQNRRQSKGVFSLIYSDLTYDQKTSKLLPKAPNPTLNNPTSITKPWTSSPRTSIEDLRNVAYNPSTGNTYNPRSSAYRPQSSMSSSRFSTFVQNDDFAKVEPLRVEKANVNGEGKAGAKKALRTAGSRVSVFDERISMMYDEPRDSMIYGPRTSSIYTQGV